ncbi:MAG: helix-turn-helix domain-containing protein [Steroidobacteraceae bacterium]
MAIAVDSGSAITCLDYRQVAPSPRLKEFVRYYDCSDVLADGTAAYPFAVSLFPIMAFYLGDPCNAYEHDAARTRHLPPVIALGLCDHRVAELLDCGHHVNFSVVFEPTGFFRLFHVSPWELRNYAHDCRDVLGAEIATLHARLCAAHDMAERVRLIEAFLLQRVDRALPRSGMQYAADLLIESRGRANLSDVAATLGLSDSSWRRHFTTQIGVAPKRYQRMLRFHHAVALKRDIAGISWTDVCQEAGFYDQSHFIAEFRELGGAAPSRFMTELAGIPAPVSRAFYRPLTENYNRPR